jgi:site-specific DNA-methyltransferase (adenine-specific)/adenine-specific DNA-methyltransferase
MNEKTLFSDMSAPAIQDHYDASSSIVLFPGDVNQFLKEVPDESIQLVITSPPYNIGKEYEKKLAIDQYLSLQSDTIKELYRVLSPKGSICWQVGNYVNNGEVFPLDIFYYRIFKEFGMYLRNRIVWHFGHGLHASRRFSGRYETLLWFTKAERDYTFNLDPVRVPSKYPGKLHYKGKNIGKPSGNPLGKNPSDIWEFMVTEWDEALWDIPNVKSNHPEKTDHPCQYPVELVERCVLALTEEGDRVLDPYAGVGTALIAALKRDRKALGSEREEMYVEIAKERIASFYQGTLITRAIGTPVHKPTGKEKVAQVPQEWKTE